jgi:hypothetical protein
MHFEAKETSLATLPIFNLIEIDCNNQCIGSKAQGDSHFTDSSHIETSRNTDMGNETTDVKVLATIIGAVTCTAIIALLALGGAFKEISFGDLTIKK